MTTTAAVLLVLYALVAFADGVILHLWRYQLFAHDESRQEHLVHTWRAILFIPTLVLLYMLPTGGLLLWSAAAIAALDLAIGLWDGWIEANARRPWGGLSRQEYLAHIAASLLHGGSLALVLVSRPVASWSWQAPVLASLDGGGAMAQVGQALLPGAVLLAIAHVWLYLDPKALLRLPTCCRPAQMP
jgi:hypothetical protein